MRVRTREWEWERDWKKVRKNRTRLLLIEKKKKKKKKTSKKEVERENFIIITIIIMITTTIIIVRLLSYDYNYHSSRFFAIIICDSRCYHFVERKREEEGKKGDCILFAMNTAEKVETETR